jgi:hypothetical protein
MKRIEIIALLVALIVVESARAGGARTKWDAELRARMDASGSVLLYRDNLPGPPSYYVSATRERVDATRDWSSNSLLPPLSLEAALKIAHGELKDTNPAFNEFHLTSAGLNRISGPGIGDSKWWYSLHFRGTSPTHRNRWFLVPVLMDGTLVQPEIFAEMSTRSIDKEPPIESAAEVQETAIGANPETEVRMSAVIIPEIDFRQANIRDVVDFCGSAIVEHATGLKEDKDTRLKVRIHKSALVCKMLPYALPEAPPLITFAARDISLLEVLNIITELAHLKMSIDGNVITVFNPKQ